MYNYTVESETPAIIYPILDEMIYKIKNGSSMKVIFSNGFILSSLSAEDSDDHIEHICLWRKEDDISYSSPMINLTLNDIEYVNYTESDIRMDTKTLLSNLLTNLIYGII